MCVWHILITRQDVTMTLWRDGDACLGPTETSEWFSELHMSTLLYPVHRYTCTVHAVQHTCTALYSCTLLVSFSANFLVKKIQWDQFVTSSLKMFFLPWQEASFCWLCWFFNANVSIRLLQYILLLIHLFDIFFLWIKIDISYIYRQAKSQRNKPFMVIVLLSTLSLESQM